MLTNTDADRTLTPTQQLFPAFLHHGSPICSVEMLGPTMVAFAGH